MATGLIRNFLVQTPGPAYFPLLFQRPPQNEDEEEDEGMLEEKPELRQGVEEEEEELEEEELEEEEEGFADVFPNSAHYALDVTKQLLRFADLISRDVQRYFGRCSAGDQDACDIYSDSVTMTTSGRLRYYDDLLKIARAGSPEEKDCGAGGGAGGGLGPLAELFDHRGPSQSRGRPMIKRHLPLSFWTEPLPRCALVGFRGTPPADEHNTHLHYSPLTHTNTHLHYSPLTHTNTHGLDGAQPDFSDLLANWDPNPVITHHPLTENTHS
ncbi:uncharacterized protein V6R79_008440 [Siganus canaliculatus]